MAKGFHGCFFISFKRTDESFPEIEANYFNKLSRDSNMHQFSLSGSQFIELNNLLKVIGLCESGGRANTVISNGEVRVDGEIEQRKRCKIRVGQIIEYAGEEITVTA